MKTHFFRLFLLCSFLLSTLALAETESKQRSLLQNYQHVLEMSEFTGATYLTFMKTSVKPAIDQLVDDGYVMAKPNQIEAAFNVVDKRVQDAVARAGGLEVALKVAKELQGETVTSESLPGLIGKIERKADRYKLANFLGLASGGGVAIRFHKNNYAYNVHYDKTEERSGRSYGVGPTRLAYDASDKAYLTDIQEYYGKVLSSEDATDDLEDFYRTLLMSLLNTDPSHYPQVLPFGQTVLSDFLAVYTAEQARNLMDNSVDIHWDAALLEVTLLASFHAGQENFKLYYFDPTTKKVSFTDQVYKQTPCKLPTAKKTASMVDYWQFSRRIDNPQNCNRSGINITKREFRLLERQISQYMATHEPKATSRVKKAMGLKTKNVNLYQALSEFLINSSTPKELANEDVEEITAAWVDYLTLVTKHADDIL